MVGGKVPKGPDLGPRNKPVVISTERRERRNLLKRSISRFSRGHFLTVAGCIRWTRYSHLSRDFESTTHRRRKLPVNLGRRRFLCPIWCLQTASCLSTACSLAASTDLGQKLAHRKIRAYPKVSRTQQSRVRRFVRRFRMVFIPLRYYN